MWYWVLIKIRIEIRDVVGGASAKGGGALNTRRAFFGAPKPPEGYFRGAEGASKIGKILLFHRKNQYLRRKSTIFKKIFKNFDSKDFFYKESILRKKFYDFSKIFKKNFFPKKNFDFFKNFYLWKKILYFAKFLKAIFQKIKFSKIDQWQLGYDYFYANFKDL